MHTPVLYCIEHAPVRVCVRVRVRARVRVCM